MLGVFLDTETNGLNFYKHRVLEIAYKIIDLYTGKEVSSFETVLYQSIETWDMSDIQSLGVTGFSYDEIKHGKEETTVKKLILEDFHRCNIRRGKAVFICQNPSFDRVFFAQLVDPETQEAQLLPYHWLDLASMYWAPQMNRAKKDDAPYPWESGFSKDLIASIYKLLPEQTPHRAMNGVIHLISCYEAMVGFPHSYKGPEKTTSTTS